MYDQTKKHKTRVYYQMLLMCGGKDFWDKVYEEDEVPMKGECKGQSKKCIYPTRATRRKKNIKYKRQLLATYKVMKQNEKRRDEMLDLCKYEDMKPHYRLLRISKVVGKRKLIE